MTSVSAIFGCRLLISPQNCSFPSACRSRVMTVAPRPHVTGVEFGGLVIESSSRPQKKATAHHRKSRPKKTQPWDVKRGPAVYPPLPEMPPEWTLVSEGASNATAVVVPEGESTQA